MIFLVPLMIASMGGETDREVDREVSRDMARVIRRKEDDLTGDSGSSSDAEGAVVKLAGATTFAGCFLLRVAR